MGNILISPHGLFSICYCRKLNRDKLIGPSQMVFCGKGLKTSLSGLHNCGQFLHLCYTYLRLAQYVNPACALQLREVQPLLVITPCGSDEVTEHAQRRHQVKSQLLSGTTNNPPWPWTGQADPQIALTGTACSLQEAVSSGGIKWQLFILCQNLCGRKQLHKAGALFCAATSFVYVLRDGTQEIQWLLLFLSHLTSDKPFLSKGILPSTLKQMLFLHLKLRCCLQLSHVVFIVLCCFNKYCTVHFSANAVML